MMMHRATRPELEALGLLCARHTLCNRLGNVFYRSVLTQLPEFGTVRHLLEPGFAHPLDTGSGGPSHQTDMTLEQSPSRSYFDGRCGPTLLVSMAVLVVVVFAIIFLFEGHNRQSSPNRGSHPITSGTPLK